ncbi:protein of unknown function [Magnetospirillum sp. XM-1]|nr:protein of unknown function [Magnetospirillum sp. XM-1]
MMKVSCHWPATSDTLSPGCGCGIARSRSSMACLISTCDVVTVTVSSCSVMIIPTLGVSSASPEYPENSRQFILAILMLPGGVHPVRWMAWWYKLRKLLKIAIYQRLIPILSIFRGLRKVLALELPPGRLNNMEGCAGRRALLDCSVVHPQGKRS